MIPEDLCEKFSAAHTKTDTYGNEIGVTVKVRSFWTSGPKWTVELSLMGDLTFRALCDLAEAFGTDEIDVTHDPHLDGCDGINLILTKDGNSR